MPDTYLGCPMFGAPGHYRDDIMQCDPSSVCGIYVHHEVQNSLLSFNATAGSSVPFMQPDRK